MILLSNRLHQLRQRIISHTCIVSARSVRGVLFLCVYRCVRVWEMRHLESDLHVNHSPPPDCSYWVKCGGNFMHGRSPSIIKQFFSAVSKKLDIPYQWLPNHVELWFHSFHEEQFITSFRQALLLPPFHFLLSLALSPALRIRRSLYLLLFLIRSPSLPCLLLSVGSVIMFRQ